MYYNKSSILPWLWQNCPYSTWNTVFPFFCRLSQANNDNNFSLTEKISSNKRLLVATSERGRIILHRRNYRAEDGRIQEKTCFTVSAVLSLWTATGAYDYGTSNTKTQLCGLLCPHPLYLPGAAPPAVCAIVKEEGQNGQCQPTHCPPLSWLTVQCTITANWWHSLHTPEPNSHAGRTKGFPVPVTAVLLNSIVIYLFLSTTHISTVIDFGLYLLCINQPVSRFDEPILLEQSLVQING